MKKLCGRLVHFAGISLYKLKLVLSMDPVYFYVSLTTLEHTPNNITDGFLGDHLPDLDQSITELGGVRWTKT